MRKLSIAAAAFLAAGPAVARPASPVELEEQTWRAFQSKNVAEISPLFAPNFVGLYADGTHDFAKELQSLQRVTIQDYKLLDMNSRAIDSDDVLLTYAAELRALVDSKPVSRRLWIASLWHREHGRWLCVYHTEIKDK